MNFPQILKFIKIKSTCTNEMMDVYRLPKGVLTASCEAELQELMKQIDIMMATKKKDWEHQIQSLQSKVELKDKENLLQKSTIDQKHKEVGLLIIT